MGNDYYKVFGLEEPADENDPQDGAGDAGGAGDNGAPAGGTGDNGAPAGGEGGAPADGENGSGGEGGSAHESGGEGGTPDAGGENNTGKNTVPPQDDKTREGASAAAAAARRRAEADAAARQDKFILDMGIQNPFNGKLITNKREYDEYKSQFEQAQRAQAEEQLHKAGVEPDALNRLIAAHPAVKAAEVATAAINAERETAKREAVRAEMDADVKKIASLGLEPDIKGLDDLPKMKNFETFREYAKKGNNFFDAYKLANYDELTARASSAAKQQALNASAGKDHLGRSKQSGAGAADVPPEVRREYLALNPNMKESEISAHYNKYLSGKK